METINLKEYDQLHIREKRDVKNNTITKDDALALQSVIMNEEPVFKWGYKKLTAQHWVGTITLKDLNIEILPKLYGYVSMDELRSVLTRMLLISHQKPSVREMPGMTQVSKNSLIEMLIETFLTSLEKPAATFEASSPVKIAATAPTSATRSISPPVFQITVISLPTIPLSIMSDMKSGRDKSVIVCMNTNISNKIKLGIHMW